MRCISLLGFHIKEPLTRGLKQQTFISCSFGDWKFNIKELVGLLPSMSFRENLFHATLLVSGGLLTIFGILWLVDISPHIVFPLCACLMSYFLLFVRTPVTVVQSIAV